MWHLIFETVETSFGSEWRRKTAEKLFVTAVQTLHTKVSTGSLTVIIIELNYFLFNMYLCHPLFQTESAKLKWYPLYKFLYTKRNVISHSKSSAFLSFSIPSEVLKWIDTKTTWNCSRNHFSISSTMWYMEERGNEEEWQNRGKQVSWKIKWKRYSIFVMEGAGDRYWRKKDYCSRREA